nr:PREDICTED: uncharacterized protein LOC104966448 [Notothenia coriiceps]
MTAALDCFDMERRERDLAVTFSITVQYGKGNSPFAAFPCNPPARLPTNRYAPPSSPSSTSSACAVKGEAYRESSLGGEEEKKKKKKLYRQQAIAFDTRFPSLLGACRDPRHVSAAAPLSPSTTQRCAFLGLHVTFLKGILKVQQHSQLEVCASGEFGANSRSFWSLIIQGQCGNYPSSCFWVAMLDGRVVGIVAAQGREDDNSLELRRMSVDSRYRGKGIAKVLGRRVLEFAVRNNYAAVVLGTTAVKLAAHKLYESLGFRRMDQSKDYRLPGMRRTPLERLFFQIRHSRYRLQLREE